MPNRKVVKNDVSSDGLKAEKTSKMFKISPFWTHAFLNKVCSLDVAKFLPIYTNVQLGKNCCTIHMAHSYHLLQG